MVFIITTVNDLRTYIANQCGGDDDTQQAVYDIVWAEYMADKTPRFGQDWSDWFEQNMERVYNAAYDVLDARF